MQGAVARETLEYEFRSASTVIKRLPFAAGFTVVGKFTVVDGSPKTESFGFWFVPDTHHKTNPTRALLLLHTPQTLEPPHPGKLAKSYSLLSSCTPAACPALHDGGRYLRRRTAHHLPRVSACVATLGLQTLWVPAPGWVHLRSPGSAPPEQLVACVSRPSVRQESGACPGRPVAGCMHRVCVLSRLEGRKCVAGCPACGRSLA